MDLRASFGLNFLIQILIVFSIFLSSAESGIAQCGAGTPTFQVNLSNNPDTTYTSPDTVRIDTCCGATAPDKCVKFVVTLHPKAVGIVFDICDGAVPPGALFYQLGCGSARQVGEALCLSGVGPHIITFCKPGNNINKYCITSLPEASVGPPITLNDGCSGKLWINGVADSTIQWRSIAPGAIGAYNSYLNCTAGCDSVEVNAQAGFPPFVDFEVRGATIGLCGASPHIDTIRVYFNSTLAVNIFPINPSLCFGDTAVSITARGSGGTPPYNFLWTNGQTDSVNNVNVGTYIVQMSDSTQCPPTFDTVVVTSFANTIAALAGPDRVVCVENLPINFNASIIAASGGRWFNGTGTYSPSDTNLSMTYTPSAAEILAGEAMLHLVSTGNRTCPADTDTVRIVIRKFSATVLTNPIHVLCNGDSNGIANIILSNALDTPYTFLWDSAALSQQGDSAFGLGPGTYHVQILDSGMCSLDTSLTITEPAAINVNDTFRNLLCFNDSSGFIYLSVSGGLPPYTYSWAGPVPANARDSLGNLSAGTYSYLLRDSNQCEYRDTFVLTQPAARILNVGSDRVICVEDSSIQLNASVQNAGGLQWFGSGSFNPGDTFPSTSYNISSSDILAGFALIRASTTGNGQCPVENDTLRIAIRTFAANLSLNWRDVLCNGDSTGYARFQLSGNAAPYSFVWDSAISSAIGDSAFNLFPSTYSIHFSDSGGCVFDTSFTIQEPSPLAVAPNAYNLLCFQDSSGAIALHPSGGQQPYTYRWSGQPGLSNNDSIFGLAAGSYILELSDSNACRLMDTINISEPPPLVIGLTKSSADTICAGENIQFNLSVSGGTPSYLINWSAGLSNQNSIQISPLTSQSFSVTVTDANTCPDVRDSMFVHVINSDDDSLQVFGNSPICQYESTTINFYHAGAYPPYTYTWNNALSPGSGSRTVSPLENTTYVMQVRNRCNQIKQDSIAIIVHPLPELMLPDTVIDACIPLEITIENDAVNPPGTRFLWTTNGISDVFGVPYIRTFQESGNYAITLSAISPQNCEIRDDSSIIVIARPLPIASFTAPVRKKNLPEVTFDVQNNSSGSIAYDWYWNDSLKSNDFEPAISFRDTGHFPVILIASNRFGCLDTAVEELIVGPDVTIELPNAFYPNKFGSNGGRYDKNNPSNQIFFPFARYVDEFKMEIYNRWGEMVFATEDINIGWDGYYKGSVSQQDVYVWQVFVKFTDGTKKSLRGELTLLH